MDNNDSFFVRRINVLMFACGIFVVCFFLALLLDGNKLSGFGSSLQGVFSIFAFIAVIYGFDYQSKQILMHDEQIRLQNLQLAQANIISLHAQFEQSWERIGRRIARQLGLQPRDTEDPFALLLQQTVFDKLELAMSKERDEILIDLMKLYITKFDSFRLALAAIDTNKLLDGALLDSKEEKIFYLKIKKLCILFDQLPDSAIIP